MTNPVDRSILLASAVGRNEAPYGPVQRVIMTPEDLANGIRGSAVDCPFAIMLRRVSWIVAVNLSGPQPTFTDQFGLEHNLSLPPDIVEWIGRFDRGEKVEAMNLIVSA